jgi:hypothetical protein
LYNPRYKKRPTIEVKDEEAYAPPVLEEGIAQGEVEMMAADVLGHWDEAAYLPMEKSKKKSFKKERSERSMAPPMLAKSAMAFGAPAPAPALASREDRAKARETSTSTQVKNIEVGDLFHYEIAHAVTVKRNGAALVPIYAGTIKVKQVAIYSKDIRDKNPMSAIMVTNTTGVVFEGGPATVLQDESYVGEAMLDTLQANEERLVPFAVELGVKVSSETYGANNPIHEVEVRNGIWLTKYYYIHSTTYSFNNTTDKKIELYLDHRFLQGGYELVDTPPYKEKTENYYRFVFELKPKQTTKFVVKERRVDSQSYYIQNQSYETIMNWVTTYKVADEFKKQLEELLKIQQEKRDVDSQLTQTQNQINDVNNNQKRLRQALHTLSNKKGAEEQSLRKRYVTEMEKDENKLEELYAKKEQLEKTKQSKDKDFNEKLNNIKFVNTL